MRALFVLLTILCFSLTAKASVDFTQTELETASPHDAAIQSRVLKDVLKIMGVKDKDVQTPPKVYASESIVDENSAFAKAAASQGMPFWALEKGINIYLIDHNVILLGSKMKLHNLAHEYAHFVQVKYFGNTREDFQFDELEFAAVEVQNNFRD